MGYNPFVKFNADILDRLISSGVKYFVRQTYDRARDHFDGQTKGIFLLSHYKDVAAARNHFTTTIKYDSAKKIYDINQPYDLNSLAVAASQPEGYQVYIDLFSFELDKWQPPEPLAKKMERYLRSSAWKAGGGEISANINYQLGVIYVTFKRGTQVMKVDLTEIDKM